MQKNHTTTVERSIHSLIYTILISYSNPIKMLSENKSLFQCIRYYIMLPTNPPESVIKKEQFVLKQKVNLSSISRRDDDNVRTCFIGKRRKKRSLEIPMTNIQGKRAKISNITKIPYTSRYTVDERSKISNNLEDPNREDLLKKDLTSATSQTNLQSSASEEARPLISSSTVPERYIKNNLYTVKTNDVSTGISSINVTDPPTNVTIYSKYGISKKLGNKLRRSDLVIAPDYHPVKSVFLNPDLSQIFSETPSDEINFKSLKKFKPLMPDYDKKFSRKITERYTERNDEEFDWYQTDDLYEQNISGEVTAETEFTDYDAMKPNISTYHEETLFRRSTGVDKQVMVLGVRHTPFIKGENNITTKGYTNQYSVTLEETKEIKTNDYGSTEKEENVTPSLISSLKLGTSEPLSSSTFTISENTKENVSNDLYQTSNFVNGDSVTNNKHNGENSDEEFWRDLLFRPTTLLTTPEGTPTSKKKWANWGRKKQITEKDRSTKQFTLKTTSFPLRNEFKAISEEESTKEKTNEEEDSRKWLLWATSVNKSINLAKPKDLKDKNVLHTLKNTPTFVTSEKRFFSNRINKQDASTTEENISMLWAKDTLTITEEKVKNFAINVIQTTKSPTTFSENIADMNSRTVIHGKGKDTSRLWKMWRFNVPIKYDIGTMPRPQTSVTKPLMATTVQKKELPTRRRMPDYTTLRLRTISNDEKFQESRKKGRKMNNKMLVTKDSADKSVMESTTNEIETTKKLLTSLAISGDEFHSTRISKMWALWLRTTKSSQQHIWPMWSTYPYKRMYYSDPKDVKETVTYDTLHNLSSEGMRQDFTVLTSSDEIETQTLITSAQTARQIKSTISIEPKDDRDLNYNKVNAVWRIWNPFDPNATTVLQSVEPKTININYTSFKPKLSSETKFKMDAETESDLLTEAREDERTETIETIMATEKWNTQTPTFTNLSSSCEPVIPSRRKCTCRAKTQTSTQNRPVQEVNSQDDSDDTNTYYIGPIPDPGSIYDYYETDRPNDVAYPYEDDEHYKDSRRSKKDKHTMCAPLLESGEQRILRPDNLLIFVGWLRIMQWAL